MPHKLLDIKYECQHQSCQVFCKKGEIVLEEAEFNALSTGNGSFKSPRGSCRMGYSQSFKVVNIQALEEGKDEENPVQKESDALEPLRALSEEHSHVLKKLDLIESQVRRRDVEGLWLSTADVENDILLHSIKKEEEHLFPLVQDKVPMGPALVGIMMEDHREFISILHGFRCGLQDGEILDGLVNSLIVNLRNHIEKEDDEFFPLIDEHISREDKDALFAQMKKTDSTHVPLGVGDRSQKGLSQLSSDRKKLDKEIMALKAISSVGGEQMCCGGH